MKLGPYAVSAEAVPSMLLNCLDSLRVQARGIPPLPGESPADIAREVLRRNARKVLYAGTGHFRFMWISDFSKALRGAQRALPPEYLRKLILYMVRESRRLGHVTSCFTAAHGFDMPYYRADNLPWLVHAVREQAARAGDAGLIEQTRPDLAWLLADYERTHFRDGLLDTAMTGDWMDTILRPSSTYSNICALHMLLLARELGLATKTDPAALSRRILEDRWREDHFTDYAGTDRLSVDAGVFALYFGLFTPKIREALIGRLRREGFDRPYPIRVAPARYGVEIMPWLTRLSPRYHSSTWLHLGLAYLNGLRRSGKEVSGSLAQVDALVLRHRNFVEAFDESGRPYSTFFHSSEYGLTMAAGQYLELVEA